MMDFALGETQQAVASLAADVLGAADPWKELAQAGLLDVSELSVLDTTVLLTEMGRHASPDSVKALATLMTGALPVARWGSADLQRKLAPRAVRTCHHLHGGLGMDVTYPLHRFSGLVADLVRFLGGAEYRLERLACSSS